MYKVEHIESQPHVVPKRTVKGRIFVKMINPSRSVTVNTTWRRGPQLRADVFPAVFEYMGVDGDVASPVWNSRMGSPDGSLPGFSTDLFHDEDVYAYVKEVEDVDS